MGLLTSWLLLRAAVPEVDYDEWAAAIAATTGDNGQIDPQQQEELYAQLPHTTGDQASLAGA